MRYIVLLLALVLAACSSGSRGTPAAPAPSSSAAGPSELRSMTVALVKLDDGNDPRLFCSGVWVGAHTILTANHCVDEAELGSTVFYMTSADVYESGITEAKHGISNGAHLVSRDAAHDLATLFAPQLAEHGVAHTRRGPADQGMFIQTMGHPLGLWFSYSTGVVAAIRELDDETETAKMVYVQGTAPISPGNSGGGLFDANGDLVGVCHAHFPAGQNLNLWIPTQYIDALLAKK